MAKGTVLKRELTAQEVEDAARLKSLWEKFQEDHAYATQAWLSKETGLGNQSLMGQYINGGIQLNPKAVLAFARVIGVHPSEISPHMDFPSAQTDDLTLDAGLELLMLYRHSTEPARKRIMIFVRNEDREPSSLRPLLLGN